MTNFMITLFCPRMLCTVRLFDQSFFSLSRIGIIGETLLNTTYLQNSVFSFLLYILLALLDSIFGKMVVQVNFSFSKDMNLFWITDISKLFLTLFV